MALSDAERAKLYRDRHRAPIEPRACSECGKRFTPARKDGVTCSPTCRKRRQRRLAKEDAISSSRRFDSDFELRHRSGGALPRLSRRRSRDPRRGGRWSNSSHCTTGCCGRDFAAWNLPRRFGGSSSGG
jgi:hypothetical protein